MILRNPSQKKRKGQALVEYGILLGGIALLSLVAVSVIGHKTNDMLSAVAAILPGAHADDNGALISGHLVETKLDNGNVVLNVDAIVANAGTKRLGNNLGVDLSSLVKEP